MRLLITLSLALGICSAFARQIPADEAKEFAQDFLNAGAGMHTRGMNDATVKDLKLIGNKPINSFHAFNIGEAQGFILVSAIGDQPMVLGYSDKGDFDFRNIPPQLKGVLENVSGFKEAPTRFSTRAGGEGVLYSTAEWGQGAPYNNLCPVVEGGKAQAGCVATAMGIAMQYHNWPDYTQGGKEFNYYHQDLTFDFDNYIPNWAAMADKENPEFADEVAKLTYSAGITAPMIFGSFESEAEVWPISHKMIYNYAYSKDCQYIDKDVFEDAEWNTMLKQQLDEVGPVIYRGGYAPGHCFVIDGYNAEGFYHVNWGWDGVSNGYWALDFSDVGGMDFSKFQGMIINITPDKEHHQYSRMFMPNAEVFMNPETNVWNFTTPDIVPGERIQVKSPYLVLNKMLGYFTLGVVDDDDNILQILGYPEYWGRANDMGTYCPYPGTDPMDFYVFPGLKEGQRYQWVSLDVDCDPSEPFWENLPEETDPKDWKIILGGMIHKPYFYDKGNFSHMVDINYHIDDNVPVYMEWHNTVEKEFTSHRLWGGDAPENYLGPKGLTYKVTCTDIDGNPAESLYVCWEEPFGMSTNISVYQHHYDVYVGYEDSGNTRHDEDINPDDIEMIDGLVYKLMKDRAALIGYENLGEKAEIPAYIISDGKEMSVRNIERSALLNAPLKELNINYDQIDTIKSMAFAAMPALERVSFQNYTPYAQGGVWRESLYPSHGQFLSSNLKEVYVDDIPYLELLITASGICGTYEPVNNSFTTKVWNRDIDYYFSPTEMMNQPDNLWTLLSQAKTSISETGYDIYKSINVPGLGIPDMQQEWEDSKASYTEMWHYAIDKENGMLLLNDVADNVKILGISINGIPVQINDEGLYLVPEFNGTIFNVTVNYNINDYKDCETTYSAEYNNLINSTDLSTGIESVIDSGSDKIVNVYNLQGICILKNVTPGMINSLDPGVYVVGGKKIYVK